MMPVHTVYNTQIQKKKKKKKHHSWLFLGPDLRQLSLQLCFEPSHCENVRRGYKALWVPECSVLGRSPFRVFGKMSH